MTRCILSIYHHILYLFTHDEVTEHKKGKENSALSLHVFVYAIFDRSIFSRSSFLASSLDIYPSFDPFTFTAPILRRQVTRHYRRNLLEISLTRNAIKRVWEFSTGNRAMNKDAQEES